MTIFYYPERFKYRLLIRRETKDNPLNNRAQYRVLSCLPRLSGGRKKVVMQVTTGYWSLLTNTPRQVGSMINPAKALKKEGLIW